MARWRIFTNDRGKEKGVPMYSGFKDVDATDRQSARMKCPPRFDHPNFAPAVAIRWPESKQSGEEKAGLKKHVG